jgi:hypothetical protein
MITTEHPTKAELTPLISGIIQDVQNLARQQLTLFQAEIKKDITRTKDAALPYIVGGAVFFIGVLLVGLTLVQGALMLWPELPAVAAYGIVALVYLIIGGILLAIGKSKSDAFTLFPDKSVEGLKENLQWTTKT